MENTSVDLSDPMLPGAGMLRECDVGTSQEGLLEERPGMIERPGWWDFWKSGNFSVAGQ